jgi:TonB family protein
MSPIFHAINIGTLATWLSVTGFGTVGILVPAAREMLGHVEKPDPFADLESIVLTEDYSVDEVPPLQQTETGNTGDSNEIDVPFAAEETLPTPPEMPEVAEISPLPEIPDLPPPTPKPAPTAAAAPTKPPPITRPSNKPPSRSDMPTSATGGSPQGKAESKVTAGNGGRNGGSGTSDTNRLAGGRMPRPSYPAEARAKGQAGTVVVEFVVGENGSVISAHVKSPSPWPLLNERAVSTVRGWKFRPGSIAKFAMPIAFKLN